MSSINKAILIGRVGKKPEIRAAQQSGNKIATFSLATSEFWKDKKTGQKTESTEWHNVVVFNKHTVDFLEVYINQGDQLYIEGKLKTRKWKDKDEKDRYTTEIVVDGFQGQVMLVSSKNKNNNKDKQQV
jgi:single-strand DNA-binding protein